MSRESSSAHWTVCVNSEIRRDFAAGGSAASVAGLFGLSEGHREVLYRDFSISVQPGQIVAVVGPSGAGKSVLLRELAGAVDQPVWLRGIGGRLASTPAVDVLRGGSLKNRLATLSRCGLAEATALVTPAGRLSGGQQYRLALARAIHQAGLTGKAKLVLADEFCSNLDTATAVVLCRQIRKLIFGSSLGLVVATPRAEIISALRPDDIIVKPLGEAPRRGRPGRVGKDSLPDPRRWAIDRGRLADYRKLEGFHYLTGPPACHKRVYVIRTPQHVRRLGGPELAAVLVVSPPVISARGRNVATFRRYVDRDRRAGLARLNSEVETISRVIVHPIFRGSGLAVRMVKHAIATSPMPIVESMAAMGKMHPFFARAGMSHVGLFKGPNQYYHYYIAQTPAQAIA